MDHLFTLPDFRINEGAFRLISNLKERAQKKIILQTRLENMEILQDAISGNISHYYQEEIRSRKLLGYPPFSKLILLQSEDKSLQRLKSEALRISSLLGDYNPLSFHAFIKKIKNNYRWNVLLKIKPEEFAADDKLFQILSGVGAKWRVIVDPESIL